MTEMSRSESKGAGVVLVCDGREIPLNPFVQRFVQETIRGLVHALDGVPEDPKTIEITLRKK
jgi:hypothetical protein